jgi:dynein heavy chain
MVRLMMEDTVLSVVKRCYFEFKDYLYSNIPQKVIVQNACQVENDYVSDEEKNKLAEEECNRLQKQRKV